MVERTFIILKPDCMEKGLEGKVLDRIIGAGLKPVALRLARLDKAILDAHYLHLKDKPFFPGLVNFMTRCPVILGVFEGEGAVEKLRALCGPTDSKKAAKGTIRGDFGTDVQENIIHASDGLESAKQEIERFFRPGEIY
ncbi:nucleoside-diphosphate kinase [Candidatus Parvarchaeota archaeon]|nr:nucleoside-diphosphate kinase [Candidatus Parvarchaeota archaeon]